MVPVCCMLLVGCQLLFDPLVVHVVIAQVSNYCSASGFHYSMISNYWFTWAVKFQGNDLFISEPLLFFSGSPTVLQVMHVAVISACCLSSYLYPHCTSCMCDVCQQPLRVHVHVHVHV